MGRGARRTGEDPDGALGSESPTCPLELLEGHWDTAPIWHRGFWLQQAPTLIAQLRPPVLVQRVHTADHRSCCGIWRLPPPRAPYRILRLDRAGSRAVTAMGSA